jgi:hypothetical protein
MLFRKYCSLVSSMILPGLIVPIIYLASASSFAQEKPATPPKPQPSPGEQMAQATSDLIDAKIDLAAAKAKEETKALDEVTLLRIQNGILRIQMAQKDAALVQQAQQAAQDQLQKDYDKFLEANKLDGKEWQLDPQRMVLVKKPKQ